MTTQTSKNDSDKENLRGKSVFIIGQRIFQNELIAFYLERETGCRCTLFEKFSGLNAPDTKKDNRPSLILIGCSDKDPMSPLPAVLEGGNMKEFLAGNLTALFNVDKEQGIEEKALASGVKGIFYNHDPLGRFQKGIGAIFEGELWFSREVLTKYVVNNRVKDHPHNQDDFLLTRREIEILAMISTGTKNEDIADKLCISPNTVKTHIYNIFKKIKVPNRLQAALWAAKNL